MDVLWPGGVTTCFKGICGCLSLDRRFMAPRRVVLHWGGSSQLESVSFHCLPTAFYVFPERTYLSSTADPSLSPHCSKPFQRKWLFCVYCLCSVFLQPFLCIPVAPPASRCLCILQPNTVCRPNTQTMLSLPSSMTPLMSTQKNPGNSQGTSSIIKSSACLWVSFQQSYHSSRKLQLRL